MNHILALAGLVTGITAFAPGSYAADPLAGDQNVVYFRSCATPDMDCPPALRAATRRVTAEFAANRNCDDLTMTGRSANGPTPAARWFLVVYAETQPGMFSWTLSASAGSGSQPASGDDMPEIIAAKVCRAMRGAGGRVL
ncbi:MAG: hypothetical protein U1E60_14700 [Reyranellaceae bacterium]